MLALRHRLEDELWDAVLDDVPLDDGDRWAEVARREGPGAAVDGLLAAFDGPSLSSHIEQHGTRELLAPLVGHLALFEMTSVVPMGRYGSAARRLGLVPAVRRFYDVHVEADAHHGDLAHRVLLGDRWSTDELDPAAMALGAHVLVRTEGRFARALLDRWSEGRSSLREPGEVPTVRGRSITLARPAKRSARSRRPRI